jgi:hypothetical protein
MADCDDNADVYDEEGDRQHLLLFQRERDGLTFALVCAL